MNNNDTIQAQAHKWSVTLSSEDVDKDTLARFEHWRTEDPRHETAFQEVDRIWRGIASLEHLRQYAKLPPAKPSLWQNIKQGCGQWLYNPSSPWRMVAGSTVLFVIAVGIFFTFPKQASIPTVISEQYQTQHAEVASFILSDGSTVTLGPESSLSVRYSEQQRSLVLTKGNALFDVKKRSAQTF